MGSEQVAQVLRQCGNRVKLVVTRGPVDENPSLSAVMPVVLPTVNEQVRTTNMEEQSFDVSLIKNTQGLGITIAGYVGDKNAGEKCTLFVDSSCLGPCLIHGLTNDRPLQVDCVNIQGYTNQQAVEVLRHTGQTVHLKLIRREKCPSTEYIAGVSIILPKYLFLIISLLNISHLL
uniref:PDZ domain-containing protein n=1 Tax=Cyclopterus lumpus TaxID=8103 RepID=A0A8C2X0N1_CYCLU